MPVRRVLLLALSAALAAAPFTAAAQPRPAAPGAQRLAVFAGVEDLEDVTGLSLRGDYEVERRALAPGVQFSIVGSLAFSRFSEEEVDPFFGDRVEATLNVFRAMPAARFTFGGSSRGGVYADAGLGLYFATANVAFVDGFTGERFEADDNEVSLAMRLGGGAFLELENGLRLGADLSLNPHFGDVDETSFALVAGVSFRL